MIDKCFNCHHPYMTPYVNVHGREENRLIPWKGLVCPRCGLLNTPPKKSFWERVKDFRWAPKFFLVLALSPLIVGFTFRWGPVTTYTDNTAIEPGVTVFYNAWQDGSPIAVKTPATSVPLSIADRGVSHTFQVQTELSTGAKSDNAALAWISPLVDPAHPKDLQVVP